jgi:hypothetical protein
MHYTQNRPNFDVKKNVIRVRPCDARVSRVYACRACRVCVMRAYAVQYMADRMIHISLHYFNAYLHYTYK